MNISLFCKKYFIGMVIISAVVMVVVSIMVLKSPVGKYYTEAMKGQSNISIDHVSSDGTIYMKIIMENGYSYITVLPLYLSDNGTQKELRWGK